MKQAMPGIIIKTCIQKGRLAHRTGGPASLAIMVYHAGHTASQEYYNNLQIDTFKQNINK